MKIDLKNKQTLTLIGIFATVSILTVSFIVYYFFMPPAGIKIVDFTHQPIQDVMSWADDNKLSDQQVEYIYEFNEEIEKDIVLSQSHQADTIVKKEEKITFTISNGSDPDKIIALPDFHNISKEEIETFFITNKFSDVTYEYIVDPKIEKDLFIKMNITSTEAKRSDLIVISISIGKENVGIDITMPDFHDSTKSNIQAWASTNNISVTFKTESSSTLAEGKVISQSVNAGETIQTGSKVTIVLSSGKGITLPNMNGKTKTEIETWAKENGVRLELYTYYSDSTEKDKIISTSPKSGTLTANSTVKIYLSKGQIVVADFTDKKESDVKNWINSINQSIYDKSNYISYSIVKTSNSTKPVGTVISTNPGKDSKIKLGGSLVITIVEAKSVNVDSKFNITVAELKSYVEGLGMKMGSSTYQVYSTTVGNGRVVRNDSGTKVVGTVINYTTSLGAFVPGSYSSKSACDSAINTANTKEAGWKCIQIEEDSTTKNKGEFIEQRNDTANKTVTIVISKGIPITVNNFVGQSKGTATQSGLVINFVDGGYSDTYGENIIMAQSITSGSKVYSGTTITLTVSKGAEPLLRLPSYGLMQGSSVADTTQQAKSLLQNAGFTNYEITSGCSDYSEGFIISESSTAPGEYKKSHSIKIVISNGTPCP